MLFRYNLVKKEEIDTPKIDFFFNFIKKILFKVSEQKRHVHLQKLIL